MKINIYRIIACSIFLSFLHTHQLYAQKDSLLKAIKTCAQIDSAFIYNKLSIVYRFSDGDSALMYAQFALRTAAHTNNIKEQGNAENAIGVQSHLKAKYDDAMTHYVKALKLFEKIDYIKGFKFNITSQH